MLLELLSTRWPCIHNRQRRIRCRSYFIHCKSAFVSQWIHVMLGQSHSIHTTPISSSLSLHIERPRIAAARVGSPECSPSLLIRVWKRGAGRCIVYNSARFHSLIHSILNSVSEPGWLRSVRVWWSVQQEQTNWQWVQRRVKAIESPVNCTTSDCKFRVSESVSSRAAGVEWIGAI